MIDTKKILQYLILITFVMVSSLAMVACSDDDDDDKKTTTAVVAEATADADEEMTDEEMEDMDMDDEETEDTGFGVDTRTDEELAELAAAALTASGYSDGDLTEVTADNAYLAAISAWGAVAVSYGAAYVSLGTFEYNDDFTEYNADIDHSGDCSTSGSFTGTGGINGTTDPIASASVVNLEFDGCEETEGTIVYGSMRTTLTTGDDFLTTYWGGVAFEYDGNKYNGILKVTVAGTDTTYQLGDIVCTGFDACE